MLDSNVIEVFKKAKENIIKGMCIIIATKTASSSFEEFQKALEHLYKTAGLVNDNGIIKSGGLVKWQSKKSQKAKLKLFDDANRNFF